MHSVVYDHEIFSQQQYGGISRYFCELAPRIHALPGFEARIVAPVHFNRHLAQCAVPQSALYLEKRIPKTGPIYRAVNALLSPPLIRAAAPSLIHQTYYAPRLRRTGRPVVLTVFDMIYELFASGFPADDPVRRDQRRCVAEADHIVCISECTANDLVRLLGVDRRKISVTHLGHSTVFEQPRPVGEVSPHARPYLLYVGLRGGYKNFAAAIEAYASSAALRDTFDVVAFGSRAFNEAEHALFARLRLAPGRVVHRTGSDADLARAYRHARALVYPSTYEGFGIPPLEAMSSGCAVACSSTSSIPEVVGEAARLFDPSDPGSMREALEQLCLDDEVHGGMVAAGRERARHFSWDRCAVDTVAAYRQVL